MDHLRQQAYLTKGVGVHREKLTSFELALRDAGIAEFNLVRVSSIFPPYCKIVPKEDGLRLLQAGEIVFVVLAEMATNEPGRRIARVGILRQPDAPGAMAVCRERHQPDVLVDRQSPGRQQADRRAHVQLDLVLHAVTEHGERRVDVTDADGDRFDG